MPVIGWGSLPDLWDMWVNNQHYLTMGWLEFNRREKGGALQRHLYATLTQRQKEMLTDYAATKMEGHPNE